MAVDQGLKKQIAEEKMPNGKKKTLLTAIDLFSKQGYSATSTSQIAKEAGVSEATIFKYFKTKSQLLDAVLKPMIEKMIPVFRQEFVDEFYNKKFATLDELVIAIIKSRYKFIYENQQLLQIFINELLINSSLKDTIGKYYTVNSGKVDEEFSQIFASYGKDISFSSFFTKLIRIMIGYFIQETIINGKLSKNPKEDLEVMAKQLMVSL